MAIAAGSVIFVASTRVAKRPSSVAQLRNTVVAVCLAGRLWAEDHGGNFPTNFTCMSNEMPQNLSCLPERRLHGWELVGVHDK